MKGEIRMRRFNVTGLCVPSEDYMVDISGKLKKIMELIDSRCYFNINRARQYGKTTTLLMIQRTLPKEYICARISFQGIGDKSFKTPEAFCKMFLKLVRDSLQFALVQSEYRNNWVDKEVKNFPALSRHITKMCSGRKFVLMIDEVDKTINNQVFLQFLGMLREKFLQCKEGMDYTFHSVILAGVNDIKNIKLKMIQEGAHTPLPEENKIFNAPWDIAVDFEVDMSFNTAEIATMLAQYESDHHTGMDVASISEEIHNYMDGYPYLVSKICKNIDEKLGKDWTPDGVRNAVTILHDEKNTLFDDISKNMESNSEL